MKIMLVDDDANIRRLVLHTLTKEGHTVVTAEDGATALEKVLKVDLDLILLDIMMPGMDGIEVCQKLKSGKKTKKIPVFMLTAKGKVGDYEVAFSVGADGYITKPFDVNLLNMQIKKKYKKWKYRSR